MLKFLLISTYLLIDIKLDFIITLFISNDYNTILIIVDYLTKKKFIYYILGGFRQLFFHVWETEKVEKK